MSKVVKLSDRVYYSIRDQWYKLKSCEFNDLMFKKSFFAVSHSDLMPDCCVGI